MKIKYLLILFLLVDFLNSPTGAQTRGWGRNDSGMLGIGNVVDPQPNPVVLGSIADDVTDVSGGLGHTLFLKANGTVLATGSNNWGQLGDNTTQGRISPAAVPGLANVVAVSAGNLHSLALLSNGTVMAWGQNTSGQVTDDGGPPVLIPVLRSGLSNVIAIDAGRDHSLALRSNGTVWAWGRNDNGQIGNGTNSGSSGCACHPLTQVGVGAAGFNNIIAISGGDSHSMALRADGTVWVWGNNTRGTLGNGTDGGNQLLPLQNTNISGVTQIAAGWNFNIALKSDGTVFGWGYNFYGNVGNGTSTPLLVGCSCRTTPVQAAITNVIDIKTAGTHTLAKKGDGSIWGWGSNGRGELGFGVVDNDPTPGNCQCRSTPLPSNAGTGNPVFGVGFNHSFSARPVITLQPGANITVYGGDLELHFSSISSVTTINILAIDPLSTGLTVPPGMTILPNSPAYDITSTPAVTGTINPRIQVSNVFSQTQFAGLRLLHGEDGALVDRTVLPNNYQAREVEGSVTSLSPFVIAHAAPTNSSVNVAGRVMDVSGAGISKASVTLTDAGGATRTVLTNPFGYYGFDNVQVGLTYVFTASHKRYTFEPQMVTVTDAISGLNFTAQN